MLTQRLRQFSHWHHRWRACISAIASLFVTPTPLSAWPHAERSAFLAGVRRAIRTGRLAEARAMLDSAGERATRDAACLNMLGAIHELRREWKAASKCYGRAIRADRRYAPAQQNMRRLYELYTFGRCVEPLALNE